MTDSKFSIVVFLKVQIPAVSLNVFPHYALLGDEHVTAKIFLKGIFRSNHISDGGYIYKHLRIGLKGQPQL